jgi:hypothetical protein
MRPILALVATALAVSVVTSTVAFAQKKSTDARAQTRASVSASYNRCVSLARSRGFSYTEAGGDPNTPARDFVRRCMKGKQN